MKYLVNMWVSNGTGPRSGTDVGPFEDRAAALAWSERNPHYLIQVSDGAVLRVPTTNRVIPVDPEAPATMCDPVPWDRFLYVIEDTPPPQPPGPGRLSSWRCPTCGQPRGGGR
jgi:hypothetical protein